MRGELERSHGGRALVRNDELGHRALHHHAGLNWTTLRRFLDSDDGLGLKGTIEDGRFHEVRRRANLMLRKGEILDLDQLYPDR